MHGIIFCDEWNHHLCLFDISHFRSINCLKAMSKRTQEDAGEERVTARSKPNMNLVSRWSVGDPNVLAPTASESSVKTRSESQNVLLSSLNVQQTSTVRPVLGASSSNYSEWNIDKKWSYQVSKSGEMSKTSPGKPVDDKFVIDYDMDSDTTTESNLSVRSLSFLNRVNDRLRKMLERSRRCNARHRQMFDDLEKVYVFDFGSICTHGKELLRQFTFHQKYMEKSHFRADVRDI